MYRNIIEGVRSLLKRFDIVVTRYSTLEQHKLELDEKLANDLKFLLGLPKNNAHKVLSLFKKSKSQIRQDLFVLSELDFKRCGFYVEFGAANGVFLSNSYLLEKEFGWNGILAEPARCWHKEIKENRIGAIIEYDCVWRDSGMTLTFNETKMPEYSTVDEFKSTDEHANLRNKGNTYRVKTISLNDLLVKHNAPTKIDYLSIDTEGSEFEILNNFDFDRYKISIITCEHNFTPERENIHTLLSSKGYQRKFENISQFEDWYVLTESAESSV
jgi:FkbM family methyltransferase